MGKFSLKNMPMQYAVGAVFAGPFFNMLLFLIAMGFEALIQYLVGHFPVVLSHFFCFTGFMVFLNPLLILLMDLIIGNYNCQSYPICSAKLDDINCFCAEGDAFKMSEISMQDNQSALVGALLTILLYILMMILSGCILYYYVFYVYLHGRILDLYWRAHGTENSFFVPEDLE